MAANRSTERTTTNGPEALSRDIAVYFERTNGGDLVEVSIRPLPGASKNAAIATANSTKTTSPIDEPRMLIERGSGREVTGHLSPANPTCCLMPVR